MQDSVLNLMQIAIKKVSNKVLKDYNQLEEMTLSSSEAAEFTKKSLEFTSKDLIRDLSKIKKNYSFIVGDEKIDNKDKSNYFIIHGILGVESFLKSIPEFCIAVSLLRDGLPEATVMFNPVTREWFCSKVNGGAYYNNRFINRPNLKNEPVKILVADKQGLKSINTEKVDMLYVSNCISLNLCYLIVGKYNSCCFLSKYKYYDVLPAIIFANEAKLDLQYNLNEEKNIISSITFGSN